MIRTLLLASTVAAALTGAASAQSNPQAGPRMTGGGPDAEVVYDAPSTNVVGGGAATIIGGNIDQRLAYGGPVTTTTPTGLVGEITGEAGNRHIVYHQAAPAVSDSRLAGRPARTGG